MRTRSCTTLDSDVYLDFVHSTRRLSQPEPDPDPETKIVLRRRTTVSDVFYGPLWVKMTHTTLSDRRSRPGLEPEPDEDVKCKTRDDECPSTCLRATEDLLRKTVWTGEPKSCLVNERRNVKVEGGTLPTIRRSGIKIQTVVIPTHQKPEGTGDRGRRTF